MNISERLPAILVIGALVGGAAIFGSQIINSDGPKAATVDVTVPTLSRVAERGKQAFDANCVQCHGADGRGRDQGPPLIHPIYNPGHHADMSFFLAAKNGVRRHHWKFGDMPPQPQVKEREVADIIRYVREIQEANGIRFQEHRM